MEADQSRSDAYFKFHGVIVKVSSADRRCIENVRRDFSWFLCPAPPLGLASVTLLLHKQSPSPIPARARKVFVLKDSVSYDHRGLRYVDYHGRARVVYDFKSEEGTVLSLDDFLLHEISYMLVLSRIGEALDRRGLHRIQSLAVSVNGSAAICLLPVGGGKTTLGLELLKMTGCLLLSDAMALIDDHLQVLPFPLRIAIRPSDRIDPGIPVHHQRPFRRIAYGEKTLIDLDYFIQSVATQAAGLEAVIFGERKGREKPALEKLSKLKALYRVLRAITFGSQLHQTKAYFLRVDMGYLRTLCTVLLSRLWRGVRMVQSVECYRLNLGENPHTTAEAIASFLRGESRLPAPGHVAAHLEPSDRTR